MINGRSEGLVVNKEIVFEMIFSFLKPIIFHKKNCYLFEENYFHIMRKQPSVIAARHNSMSILAGYQFIFIGLAYYQGKDIVFRFIIEYTIAHGQFPHEKTNYYYFSKK
jgi:hypothetical protein